MGIAAGEEDAEKETDKAWQNFNTGISYLL
jgi:hypothetical protein